MPLVLDLPQGGTETVSYTVNPKERGEYDWGDIQIQQQGAAGPGPGLIGRFLPPLKSLCIPDLIGLNQLSI